MDARFGRVENAGVGGRDGGAMCDGPGVIVDAGLNSMVVGCGC